MGVKMLIHKSIEETDKKRKTNIDLRLKIKDFGPISFGEIEIKPLTIFIGPNNSGKSYASMLIHSIFESFTSNFPKRLLLSLKRYFYHELIEYSYDAHINELMSIINEHKGKNEFQIPKHFIKNIYNGILKEIFEKRLSNEIVRSYACPLKELVRINKKNFEFEIVYDSFKIPLIFDNNEIKIKEYPNSEIKITIKLFDTKRPVIEIKENLNEIQIELSRLFEKKRNKFIYYEIMRAIFEVCVKHIIKKITTISYYLPAARSGIIQGHRALAASIVRKAPYVGIEKFEIPKFSGVVSDFISSLLELPDEKSSFYELAVNFEKELIKGEILVRTIDEYREPEIKYKFNGAEIPLHRTSSTVSELAPLFLYLKYYLERDNILIIEEPEAHLHPQNQLILAKYLVRMIRKGLHIVITTHSDFLLEQINNLILLSRIEGKRRKEKYNYDEEDYLDYNEVSAYLFEYDNITKGHKIIRVEITRDEGISEEEFLKVNETLYEESLKIRRDLDT